jgi:hypothetical protein
VNKGGENKYVKKHFRVCEFYIECFYGFHMNFDKVKHLLITGHGRTFSDVPQSRSEKKKNYIK